jgi:DNA invertase Pin-like site-specific DNA recombinase
MQTAWAYLVVSTAKQAETLEDQERWVTDAASVNGWEITRTFRGVSSGSAGVRKLLEELIAALQSTPKVRRPKRICMIRLDRTGRGLGLDAIAALAAIHKLGVTIHTRQDGDVSLARVTDVFLPVIRVLTAATENEARRDKALATYSSRRAAGKHVGSLAPYGVSLVKGEPQPVEPQASVVRRAYELRAQGHGYRTIVRELHAASPPKIRRDGTPVALAWNPSSVRYMIRCKTYKGVVVDPGLWDRANAVSNRNSFTIKESTRYPWPLGGAVKCECGRRLIGNPSKSNWKGKHVYSYRYYLCLNVSAHDGKLPRHRAEKLEGQLPELFVRLKATPLAEETYARELSKGRGEIEARMQAVQQQIKALSRRKSHAWDAAAEGGISNDDLRERLKALDVEMDSARRTIERDEALLDAILASEDIEEGLQEVFSDLAQLWPEAGPSEQRAAANALSSIVGGLVATTDGALKTFLDAEQDRLQM